MTLAQQSPQTLDFQKSSMSPTPAPSCPNSSTAGVGQQRLSRVEDELDAGLDFFAVQGALDRKRMEGTIA